MGGSLWIGLAFWIVCAVLGAMGLLTRRRGGAEKWVLGFGVGGGDMELDSITGCVVDAAYRLHLGLGPGLLESVYETVLHRDLVRRGLHVEQQSVISFEYGGMYFENGLRVDLLVEGRVVVELKSVEHLLPVHRKQVLTYLKLLRLPVGLLINFGAPTFKAGLQRIVNNLPPSASPHLRVNHPT
jgi:GxxExxY protein